MPCLATLSLNVDAHVTPGAADQNDEPLTGDPAKTGAAHGQANPTPATFLKSNGPKDQLCGLKGGKGAGGWWV
jgi:hypothetical protein